MSPSAVVIVADAVVTMSASAIIVVEGAVVNNIIGVVANLEFPYA